MIRRNIHHLLARRNCDLMAFANVHVADNMSELMEAASQSFNRELANSVFLMTPHELNKLLDAARVQGRNQW